MRKMLLVAAGSALLLVGAARAQDASHVADPHQILWQRSLPDALALAKATGRPLLVVLNMDGESASERIGREMYRDPEFVALARRCVCVVASVFRHSPRDYDEHGRRIPCPRLGEVTCGEHMALEPVLFEAYLSDGERVAPRHALILPNGVKAWDHALLFDLRDVERRLAGSVLGATSAHDEPAPEASVPPPPQSAEDWAALAARRDQRGRAALEEALASTTDEAAWSGALDALAQHGDAGALPALRILCARAWQLSPELSDRLLEVVHGLGLEGEVAAALKELIAALPAADHDGARDAAASAALALLAKLDGESVATRSLVLGALAIARGHGVAARAARIAFDAGTAAAIDDALAAHGGPCDLGAVLDAATAVTTAPNDALPRPGPSTDAMPAVEELLRTLDELDRELRAHPDDAELHAKLGKASLDLARRRIEAGDNGAQALLEDAERGLARALQSDPKRYEWWVERARTAYFASHFADEVAFGARALQVALDDAGLALPAGEGALAHDRAILDDGQVIEAMRWIGDGNARLLAARAGKDAAVEVAGIVDGLRALALVAASPFGDGTDWLSLGSFLGAIGLPSDELDALTHGVQRLPADAALWQELNGVLWNGGRIDRAPAIASDVARRSDSPDADWHEGYAWMLQAENLRRQQQPAAAIDAYRQARSAFATCAEQQPRYADSCERYRAVATLGIANAHLLTEDRTAAADALVAAIEARKDLLGASDGLGRDLYDVVDQILEWRESGPTPVDPTALLDRLEKVDPGQPFWGVAIADSELREALRADGRNPDRVERDTVDAGGNPIRMPMGLPTEEGDRYLQASIVAARRALRAAQPNGDPPPLTDETSPRHALAQSDTIWAERMLQRDRTDGVREALAEAATLAGLAPPAADADAAALGALAHELRGMLGEPRPRLRDGR